MSRTTRSRGFTLVGLLVVIGVIALLISILLPALNRARETSNRVKCAMNLNQIGKGLLLYANENRGIYPRTLYAPADSVIPDVTNAGYDSPDFTAADSKVPKNCVTSGLFLLLRNEDLVTAVFICPSTTETPDANPDRRSNFTSLHDNLSYSYANPYPDIPAVGAGYKLTESIDPGFAVASDKNPGMANGSDVISPSADSPYPQIRAANSKNHGADGQNILFGDGHVEFNMSPFAGISRDNVFIRGPGPSTTKDDIVNSPKDNNDSVLLPTEEN